MIEKSEISFVYLRYLLLTLFSPLQKLPPKRPNLPAALFNMKELPPGGEEEEEEEEAEINKDDGDEHGVTLSIPGTEDFKASTSEEKTLKDESLEVKGKNNVPSEGKSRMLIYATTRWQSSCLPCCKHQVLVLQTCNETTI